MTAAEEPLISVVIPLYNKEKYVRRAVDSVLAQSFRNFELIVVNDGSTDNSPAIVRQYSDPRIRLIDQENRGVSAARNRGIRDAQGELIAFLDADDEWKSTFLETIKKLAANYPSAGLYVTSYRIVMPNGRERDAKFRTVRPAYIGVVQNYFGNAYRDAIVTSNTAVIAKRVFDTVGFFDEGIRFGEDLLMWYKVALTHDVVIDNSVNATYFQNAAGRSSLQKKGANVAFFGTMKKQCHRCGDSIPDDKRQWAQRYYRYLIRRKCRTLLRGAQWAELLTLSLCLLRRSEVVTRLLPRSSRL